MKITYEKKGKEYIRKGIKKFMLTLDNGMRIELWSHGKNLQMRSMNDQFSHLTFKPVFPWSVAVDCIPETKADDVPDPKQAEFWPKRRRRSR